LALQCKNYLLNKGGFLLLRISWWPRSGAERSQAILPNIPIKRSSRSEFGEIFCKKFPLNRCYVGRLQGDRPKG